MKNDIEQPPKHPLPYIALALTFIVPILSGIFFATMFRGLGVFFVSVAMLSPIAGILTAIVALCLGKKKIGASGQAIAIVVIAVPLAFIAAIVPLFFILTAGTFTMHM